MRPTGDWNHKAKVAGYSEIQVSTGLVDQMGADVERWVLKQITARNKEGQVNGLLSCYVYQCGFRHLAKMCRQKLYVQWTEALTV